jgi:hypothetical protein
MLDFFQAVSYELLQGLYSTQQASFSVSLTFSDGICSDLLSFFITSRALPFTVLSAGSNQAKECNISVSETSLQVFSN